MGRSLAAAAETIAGLGIRSPTGRQRSRDGRAEY